MSFSHYRDINFFLYSIVSPYTFPLYSTYKCSFCDKQISLNGPNIYGIYVNTLHHFSFVLCSEQCFNLDILSHGNGIRLKRVYD